MMFVLGQIVAWRQLVTRRSLRQREPGRGVLLRIYGGACGSLGLAGFSPCFTLDFGNLALLR